MNPIVHHEEALELFYLYYILLSGGVQPAFLRAVRTEIEELGYKIHEEPQGHTIELSLLNPQNWVVNQRHCTILLKA